MLVALGRALCELYCAISHLLHGPLQLATLTNKKNLFLQASSSFSLIRPIQSHVYSVATSLLLLAVSAYSFTQSQTNPPLLLFPIARTT